MESLHCMPSNSCAWNYSITSQTTLAWYIFCFDTRICVTVCIHWVAQQHGDRDFTFTSLTALHHPVCAKNADDYGGRVGLLWRQEEAVPDDVNTAWTYAIAEATESQQKPTDHAKAYGFVAVCLFRCRLYVQISHNLAPSRDDVINRTGARRRPQSNV